MLTADVIRLAAEAAIGNHLPKVNGLPGIWAGPDLGPLERFAALVEAEALKSQQQAINAAVMAEREACADIVENANTPDCGGWTAQGIADAIRARPQLAPTSAQKED